MITLSDVTNPEALLRWLGANSPAPLNFLEPLTIDEDNRQLISEALDQLLEEELIDGAGELWAVTPQGRITLAIERFKIAYDNSIRPPFEAAAYAVLATLADESIDWPNSWVNDALCDHLGHSRKDAIDITL